MQTEKVSNYFINYQGKKETQAFRITMEGDIAEVIFDLPGEKANKWSTPAIAAFYDVMNELEEKKPKAAIFLSAKSSIFIAGADINEIKSINTEEDALEKSELGQALFERWEHLPFPTVAAIHGATMGGGTEFALSCTARICSDDSATRIGLPEVMLGILPGWGGTQRLPRMIGLMPAMDVILSGRTMGAREVKKLGLVSDAVPKELLRTKALQLARRLIEKPYNKYAPKRAFATRVAENMFVLPAVFIKARQQVIEKTQGNYPAPLSILKVLKKTYSVGAPTDRGYTVEAREFARLAVTPEAKNLVELFFLNEAAKKTVYPSTSPVQGRPVDTVTVLGAGVMGAGIAQSAAGKGLKVYLKDTSEDFLSKGMSGIAKSLEKLVKRRKMTAREKSQFMAHLHPVTSYQSGVGQSQLIIEAIVEQLEVKQSVFAELEKIISPQAILASNTSTLSVKAISAKAKHPERVIGLHFFNPVEKMPLVEIVTTDVSSDQAVATGLEFAKKLGKTPVVCKDAPGFVVNRILGPYLNESAHLAVSRVSLEEVDRALKTFGLPMGPYRLMDEVGFDICEKAGKILHHAFGDRLRPPQQWIDELVKRKILGRKTGNGFYTYAGKKERFNQEIYSILGWERPAPSGSADAEKWVKRLLYPMVNEAARVLEEKIVEKPSVVDIAMIMGTGFAPFRGGLLRWADSVGVSSIVADLEEMGSLYASTERFQPCTYLKQLAASGKGFYNV